MSKTFRRRFMMMIHYGNFNSEVEEEEELSEEFEYFEELMNELEAK